MASRFTALIAVAFAFTTGAAIGAEEDRGDSVLNAFATRLAFTPEQKEQAGKIHADFEQKSAPICEQMWKLHCEHHKAVLQILSAEQIAKLPDAMKEFKAKMFQEVATKLELNASQKTEAEKVCTEYGAKFQALGDGEDANKSEKFQELKRAQWQAFSRILTDDQRVKLPALIQEELQSGKTPTAKSEYRNTMAEKLSLTADQKTRLDKVCDEFAPKIDEQKAKFLTMCKEKQSAVEKILTETQRTKFLEYVKADAK